MPDNTQHAPICPACSSPAVSQHSGSNSEEHSTRFMRCSDCRSTWERVYTYARDEVIVDRYRSGVTPVRVDKITVYNAVQGVLDYLANEGAGDYIADTGTIVAIDVLHRLRIAQAPLWIGESLDDACAKSCRYVMFV